MTSRNIIMVIVTCLASFGLTQAEAQNNTNSYVPTTNWPYVNADFEEGIILLDDSTQSRAEMNIHLQGSVLQCINSEGKVARVTFPNIKKVEIAGKTYTNYRAKFMQLIKTNNDSTASMLLEIEPDYDELLRNANAYYINMGTVTTAKIQQLNLKGRSNEKYDEMKSVWYDGKKIDTRKNFYFLKDGNLIPATRNGVLGNCKNKEEKHKMKSTIKKNKTDWDAIDDVLNIFNILFCGQNP